MFSIVTIAAAVAAVVDALVAKGNVSENHKNPTTTNHQRRDGSHDG
jgi:hypothetical protein